MLPLTHRFYVLGCVSFKWSRWPACKYLPILRFELPISQTGVAVACQEEHSRKHKNKAKAMKLFAIPFSCSSDGKSEAEIANERKEQVVPGNVLKRFAPIIFPQNRVLICRVHVTLKKLDMVMEGEIDDIVDALMAKEREGSQKKSGTFPNF